MRNFKRNWKKWGTYFKFVYDWRKNLYDWDQASVRTDEKWTAEEVDFEV